MAVDEIEFFPNKRCPPISEFGNTVTHYCDFETDDCGYSISGTSGNKWQRSKPSNDVFGNLPVIDNTLQTQDGYFFKSNVIKNLINIFLKFKLSHLI